MNIYRKWLAFILLSPAIAIVLPIHNVQAADAKNIILMISDGAGYNTWDATSMYEGKLGNQVYDGAEWVKYGCSTYPLINSSSPTGNNIQDASLVYDTVQAWDSTPDPGAEPFVGYDFLKSTYTDSAAAATALSTGVKTYNNAINWSDLDTPIVPTICERANGAGKSVGTITSVEWSHATPAGLSNAHNSQRGNYSQIANSMLNGDVLDVIMGAGNPDYDVNGQFITTDQSYSYVGGQTTWESLKTGSHTGGWQLIESKSDFEAIADGTYNGGILPTRLVGTAQVATTLQQDRSGGNSNDPAYADPFIDTVPTLETMTKAALNILDDNPNGLFLHVEGGAVDWANHDKQGGRMIEEQIDFNNAVQAVVDWIETNSSWEESLLILTADHECGLLWGPDSYNIAYDPIVDNGQGNMPGLMYNSGSHSNSLVPVYAKGVNSELFDTFADEYDPIRGYYIDNTEIFEVMNAAIPEPGISSFFVLFTFTLLRRKR